MADLSEALKQAFARSDSSTRHLIGVEILHAAMPGGVRLAFVNYDEAITLDGIPHTGMAMQVKEPELSAEPTNVVKVRIDGVAGTFQYYINAAVTSGTTINVNLRTFGFNMTTQSVIDITGPYPYLVTQADYDMNACVLHCGHISPTNQKFPKLRYTPDSHPGLYKG